MSYDYSHMPFHHQKKRNIKSRKIDKRKRKMLVSKHTITVKIEDCGLSYSLFSFFLFFISFSFWFIFFFLFLELYRVRVRSDQSHCHISHIWWCGHNIDHGTQEKEVEGSRTKWCHTTWILYVGLILYIWSFRIGCTVASMDHL